MSNTDNGHDKISSYLQSSDSLLLEDEVRRQTGYLQTLKKNCFKIELIIGQNNRLKHENTLQLKTIQMHLKKQIQMKYLVSNLQAEIQLLNMDIRNLNAEDFHQISSLEVMKQTKKLQNCIVQNEILRKQNRMYREKQYEKQKNFQILEQRFKQTMGSNTEKIHLLTTELHYQTQKACLLQKIQAENNLLKIENRKLCAQVQNRLQQYHQKISRLLTDLQKQKIQKMAFQQKYNQLSEVISLVDQMRQQFKCKKKSIEYFQEEKTLLNKIQLNPPQNFIDQSGTNTKSKLKSMKTKKIGSNGL